MKPVILITASRAELQNPIKSRYQIASLYSDCIRRAGGIPVVACGGNPSDYAALCDAVLFSGGDDVHPSLFGETVLNEKVITEPIRDEEELALFDAFFRGNKKIFGICRGIQLINVALGGSLWQDISTQIPDSITHTNNATHSVKFSDNSLFHQVFDREILVNSFHHQSIKRLGDGLIITARSTDDIIEAVETLDGQIVAVQWHPERMANKASFDKCDNMLSFFEKLIEIAKG